MSEVMSMYIILNNMISEDERNAICEYDKNKSFHRQNHKKGVANSTCQEDNYYVILTEIAIVTKTLRIYLDG